MKAFPPILAFLAFSMVNGLAQTPIRFMAVDIFVDSGTKALGAYQVELKAMSSGVKIVGIEGGEDAAFTQPPFYDPKAMQQERAVLAAFSTTKILPKGKTRVATVHVQVTGESKPEWTVKLVTAADASGKKIAAVAEVKERTSQ